MRYIAGGTDVLVEEAALSDRALISLRRIDALRGIRRDEDGTLHIGVMTTIADLEQYLKKTGTYPALAEAIGLIGSPQIRNAATLGGNICSSLPSADSIGPLLIYDAKLILHDGAAERTLDMNGFCTGPGKNVKNAPEILKEVVLPPEHNARSAYVKHGRRNAMEIALAGASVLLDIDRENDVCRNVRVALTTSAPTHVRASRTEEFLTGKRPSEENIAAASRLANETAKPRTSFRCTAEYRLSVIPVLVERAMKLAMTGGERHV